jgi:nitroreductase
MDLHEALYGRRSVREYENRPVERAALTGLIDAAIQAPSAVNEQPWAFTVIQDRALLERISQQSKTHLLNISAPGMTASRFRDQLANPDFHIFYHAPALIVISTVTVSHWSVENCTLAAQNLMLAAYEKGLGTCWIGFAEHWLQTVEGKHALQLPNHHFPVAPIIVGYPRSHPPAVERRRPSIHWIG